jgi:hypothetical protein
VVKTLLILMPTTTRRELKAVGAWTLVFGLGAGSLGFMNWNGWLQLAALGVFFLGVSLLAPYSWGWTDTPPDEVRERLAHNDGGAPKGAA